ncbi:MAG: hypothetical protein WBL06_05290 [Pseudolysinimonas sp.]|uniref:hypothetical protein n=1 Tax=Pseudolysinimonas sp. TaxID=2680009 RepID=UPI003C766F25
MEPLEIIRLVLLAVHILGLAAIVGAFFVQLRAKDGFATGVVLAGAITQLVTGLALVGVRQASDHGVNNVKIAVKLGIAVVVLVAAIIAHVRSRRGGKVKPAFHTAGGLAVVNVLVAVLWQ